MAASEDTAEVLRHSAADFLRRRESASTPTLDISAPPTLDRSLWRDVAELGWLGIGLVDSDLGLREIAVLCEQLGRSASRVPYIAASVLPSVLLAQCESTVQLSEWASSLSTGERLFALAWQERARELVPALPHTTLSDGRVSGTKHFVAGAEADSVLLVSVRHEGELAWVAVGADAPGVSMTQHAAGLGSEATIHFDGAPVLGHRLASGPRAQQALELALQSGRIALAAQLAGLAGGLLDKTMAHIGQRVQFGRPLSSFQVLRHRCVDLYVATRLAGATWQHALRSAEEAPQSHATTAAVSAAKARCGDVAVEVGREAVQMHGAMGFIEEGGVGLYLRSALHARAWLGTPLGHRRQFMALQVEHVHE